MSGIGQFPPPNFHHHHDPAESLEIATQILKHISTGLKSPGTRNGGFARQLLDTYLSNEFVELFGHDCYPQLSQLLLDAIGGLHVDTVGYLLKSHPLHEDFQRSLIELASQTGNPVMAWAMSSCEEPSSADDAIAQIVDLVFTEIRDVDAGTRLDPEAARRSPTLKAAKTSLLVNKMKMHQFLHRNHRKPDEATALEWAIVGDKLPQTALVLVTHQADLSQQVSYTSVTQKFTFNLRDHLFLPASSPWDTFTGWEYVDWLRDMWEVEVRNLGEDLAKTEWMASFERVVKSCHSYGNRELGKKPKAWSYWTGEIHEVDPRRLRAAYTLFDVEILDKAWREGDVNTLGEIMPRSLELQSRMDSYRNIQQLDLLRRLEPMPKWAAALRKQLQQHAQSQMPPLQPLSGPSNPAPKGGRKATPSTSGSTAPVRSQNTGYDSQDEVARKSQGPGNRRY